MSQVKREKAFSLIELLIVIALLAIILLIVFRQFGGDLGKSRDGERKNDLKQIKLAMENYYNDNGSYPPVEYLSDCGGPSLQPYMKEVPCDPVTGDPYLYLPDLVSGEEIHAYRILSFLSNTEDPIIEQLGCQNGCGIPPDHESFPDSLQYVYGVAEGVPLVLDDIVIPTFTATPTVTVTLTATPTPTPSPGGDPSLDCSVDVCYCCGGVNQTCNVYTTGFGQCVYGPYATGEQCHSQTVCDP